MNVTLNIQNDAELRAFIKDAIEISGIRIDEELSKSYTGQKVKVTMPDGTECEAIIS